MNTLATVVVLGLAGAAAVLIMLYPWLARRLRPTPALATAERERLLALLPWTATLEVGQQQRLLAAAAGLLARARFIGCAGFEIGRDAELIVAGQAGLLCLGALDAAVVEAREILIYPDAFYIHHAAPDEHGLVDDAPMLAAGEAWDSGRVVLSWPDIEAALAGADHNVIVHEFAHLLDFAEPAAEGAPPMADFAAWAEVFSAAFEQLSAAGSPVLDVYGSEHPREFFAVALEAFFQRGTELAAAHHALYQALAAYFELDPAARPPRFGRAPILR